MNDWLCMIRSFIHCCSERYILIWTTCGAVPLWLCSYLRQVQDEVLRASTLAPFAARFSDEEVVVGGYTLPPKVRDWQVEATGVTCVRVNHARTSGLCMVVSADPDSASFGRGPGGQHHLA